MEMGSEGDAIAVAARRVAMVVRRCILAVVMVVSGVDDEECLVREWFPCQRECSTEKVATGSFVCHRP